MIKSVHLGRYQSIIGHWVLMIEMPVDVLRPFPSYNDAEDQIMKYDRILSKNEKSNQAGGNVSALSVLLETNSFISSDQSNGTITCMSCRKRGYLRKD